LSCPEMYPVAILTGGLARRLHPITQNIPKALVEVAGTPFICRQLDYLRRQGVARAVLCIGHLGEQIEAVTGDGRAFGIEIRYSPDGPLLLGTAGALKRALPLLGERFFVLYGDSYLPCDFHVVQRAFVQSGKTALMTVYRNQDRWDKSNVLFRDGRVLEYNKGAPKPEMEHIDYGLGVLSSATLDAYPEEQPFDLADVYHELSLTDRLAGFEVSERFYEIGSYQGLQAAEAYFSGVKTT